MPHTRSGPAYNSYKSAHPRQISGGARRISPELTFAAAARHAIHAAAIHAATRLATGARLAAGTARIAARTRVGETKCRLQRIGLARTALRRAAFATGTPLALTLAGGAWRTALRRALERRRRTRLAALERTLWLATTRTTRFARTAGAAWTTTQPRVWDPGKSSTVISPLVAVSIAPWAFNLEQERAAAYDVESSVA